MNFKNIIYIRGIIQEKEAQQRGSRTMYALTVMTKEILPRKDGSVNIREELLPCVAWPGKYISTEKLRSITTGNVVYIKGRLSSNPELHVFIEELTVSKDTNISPSVKIDEK